MHLWLKIRVVSGKFIAYKYKFIDFINSNTPNFMIFYINLLRSFLSVQHNRLNLCVRLGISIRKTGL